MPSPYERAVEVAIDGQPLDQNKYRIGNLRLHQPLYDHHEFELEVLGVQVGDSLAAIGESADLKQLQGQIGSKFELTSGHGYMSTGRSESLDFEGVITNVEARTDYEAGYSVVLRGYSPTVKLDDVPRNRVLADISASDFFQAAAGERGLTAEVETMLEKFPELVQRGVTDWKLALTLFGQAGMHLYYDGRKIRVKKKIDGDVIALSYAAQDSALLQFSLESVARPGKLKVHAWGEQDAKKTLLQSTASAKSNASVAHEFTKKAESASASLFSVEGNAEPLKAPGSQSWLDADAGSARGAWIASLTTGRGSSDNNALSPGKLIDLTGFGNGLNGKYLVTSVTHSWSDERLIYSNSFECVPELSAAPPRGQRTANQHEIWTARVVSLNDPQAFGRVQVQFLNFEQTQWVRLASFYANDAGGFFCYPEIGDEVIVSFVDGDDRYPVIIGSVLHPKALGAGQEIVQPGLADESNNFKVFRTRSGHRLQFDETENAQKIELETPSGEVLLRLDATSGAVKLEIVSQGDVSIIAAKGCTVTAKEDVTVNTEANATVNAEKDIVFDSKANITMKAAQNIKIEGGMEVEVKGGSGSVKAAASGVDVKGPMVKLN